MSTQEPGGTQPEGGTPGYAQPQDPWAGGFDYGHGQASVPTDPHPPQFDPLVTYGQEFGTGHNDPWGGPTANQGAQGWPQQPGSVPPAGPVPQRSRAVPILIALLVVVVLGAAAGAIYWFTGRSNTGATGGTPSPGSVTTGSNGVPGTPKFNPHAVAEGGCLRNYGTDKNPEMRQVECGKNAFKVLKIARGENLPKNAEGKFDEFAAAQACSGVNGYKNYYAFNSDNNTQDLIFCMSVIK